MSMQRKCKLCTKHVKRSDYVSRAESDELLQYVLNKFQVELGVNEKLCTLCLNNLNVMSNVLKRWQQAQRKAHQVQKRNQGIKRLDAPKRSTQEQSPDDAAVDSVLKSTQSVRTLRSRKIKVEEEDVTESVNKKVEAKNEVNLIEAEQLEDTDCDQEVGPKVSLLIKSETALKRKPKDVLANTDALVRVEKLITPPSKANTEKLKSEAALAKKSADNINSNLVAVLNGSNGVALAVLYLDDQANFDSDEMPNAYTVCNCCSKGFTRLRDLTKHLKTQRKQYFECEECMQSFDTIEMLQKHQLATVHVGVCIAGDEESKQLILYNCSQCDKIFRDYWGTLRHYREVHIASNDRFKCSECGATYKYRISLEQHLAKHLNLNMNTITCTLCPKTFRNNYQLGVHMRSHTGEQPYLCLTCYKRFSHRANLQVHQRTHTGELPFKCEQCGKAFRTTSHLRRHSTVCRNGKQRRQRIKVEPVPSETEGDFQYNEAMSTQGKGVFTLSTYKVATHQVGQQSLLRTNVRKSTQPQILNVDVVSKLSSLTVPEESSQLTVHKCNHCNKGYTQRSALIKHMRTHSGENPFTCLQCGKAFADAVNFKQHKLLHVQPKVHTDETIKFEVRPLATTQVATDSDPDPDGLENREQLNFVLTAL